ncbi:2-amino-4-hydroxy-6-hydroxymethyldihydropteridine diphosphokinase [Anaplasma capra]|uniref:2-amino-4-hydroxy-6- hydroxymethyldihydropteridine diphosphokinase n=1 Tax=Anaplasma capra TaxID=1562740 RepID=UPI0021D60C9D|nr:2-amino-4-hydroxy-6-hydroxymethyldihydropteridine diphosphokinase [Anaplasma capra]MCU7611819.1 2-amino-4-hydroxy-6-hydroxymethyldihydropteridine diphosphokinase [Anaplasma capra]MCU7612587.1 2-amino-4-hydroxy-6-hydroxymethyldihydropteridine diphosphokinase [Anaplasma capra]
MMVVLALGSNLGARVQNLKAAAKLLPVYNRRYSYIYKTKALLPEGAPAWYDIPFLNMVISGYVNLSPMELLECTQQIEYALGRQSTGTWSPRFIDIDILLYGNLSMQSDVLTIPHREMHNRDFVLVPACDVCPRYPHTVLAATLETMLLSVREINVVKECGIPSWPGP